MTRFVLTLAGLALALATPSHAAPFGNADIVALHQAGLASEAIIAKIRSAPCSYDTSTAALISLRKAEVPQAVIVAVLNCANNAASPAQALGRESGITMATASGTVARLRPAAQSSLKLTGNGSILFPSMARLIVPQPSAQAASRGPRPVFTFQFDPSGRHASDFGEVSGDVAQSPAEFSLVRFRVDGGNRQVTVGRVQPYVAITGIDPKNTLPFTVTELGAGAFRVTMPQDLAPGQYGFVMMGERERRKGTVFRIYDFGVDP